jgi:hypothetical protein
LGPGFVVGLVFGLTLYYLFGHRRKDVDVAATTFQIIKSRRSITPKSMNGDKLTPDQLSTILEAANWAPTHKKTEPWLFFRPLNTSNTHINYFSILIKYLKNRMTS